MWLFQFIIKTRTIQDACLKVLQMKEVLRCISSPAWRNGICWLGSGRKNPDIRKIRGRCLLWTKPASSGRRWPLTRDSTRVTWTCYVLTTPTSQICTFRGVSFCLRVGLRDLGAGLVNWKVGRPSPLLKWYPGNY